MSTTGAAGKDGPGRGLHPTRTPPHVGGPERPWARRLPSWSDPSVRRQDCHSRGRTWRRPAVACRSWRKPLVAPPESRIQRRTSRPVPWPLHNWRTAGSICRLARFRLGGGLGHALLDGACHAEYIGDTLPCLSRLLGFGRFPPPRTWVSPHRRSRSRRAPALEAHDTSDEGRRIAVRASLAALSVGVACVEWR